MEILGIGVNELVFIVIIALIVLGPKDMQKAGKTIGKWMRDIVTSEGWKVFQKTSHELRTLPNRLMREANEELTQINSQIKDDLGAPFERPKSPGPQPPRSQSVDSAAAVFPENKIAPMKTEPKAGEPDPESDA